MSRHANGTILRQEAAKAGYATEYEFDRLVRPGKWYDRTETLVP